MACCCLHKHVLKMASRPFSFSNRSSNYKSYQFGPRSAFRTPPPIPCPMPLMNSLWPATFWVSGRQTFFASSFLHAEKTAAKSADGHPAPAFGPLWLLTTLVTLLRKLYSKHHPTPGQMFSEHPWCVAVYTNMSPKWATWPLDFSIGVLITNRTNSDLVQPSVHNPLFPAPCPL